MKWWLVLLVTVTGALASCPWQEPGLIRTSTGAAWPNGKVPTQPINYMMTISKNLLLDSTLPAFVGGIKINAGAKLIVSPEKPIKLSAAFIEVHGEFIIGTEKCPFSGDLELELLGRRNAGKASQDFGRKYIGVSKGGVLEMHGSTKLPWTKLSKTLPKLTPSNGLYLDHENSKDARLEHWRVGMMVQVLDSAGKPVKFTGYTFGDASWAAGSIAEFTKYLSTVPQGSIVMLASRKSIARLDNLKIDLTSAIEEVERLLFGSVTGKSKLRSIAKFDAYVAIAKIGDPSFSEEVVARYNAKTNPSPDTSVLQKNFKNNFLVSVRSQTNTGAAHLTKITLKSVKYEAVYPVINLIEDVSTWQPGERLLLLSTDYDYKQAEEATILPCPQCTNKQKRIHLEAKHTHFGEFAANVDERGEVALLSRNIKIHGQMQDDCPAENGNCKPYPYDTFGGHIKILKGFKQVNIQFAELYHMGQQTDIGHYPIHFHLCEDVDKAGGYASPPMLKGNSIHHTFARCVTAHGTHGLQIWDNVAWDHLGHCFFLEDGGEQRTVLAGNLGAGTKKASLLPSDEQPTTYWLTNPRVVMKDNVAAGGERHGIWYIFPDEPTGPSRALGHMAAGLACRTPLTEFYNNVVHSYSSRGLMVENRIGDDLKIVGNTCWSPRVNPSDPNSPTTPNVYRKLTAYKNRDMNFWVRGGESHIVQASLADSAEAGIFAKSQTGNQYINESVVVGETANLGEPSRWWNYTLDAWQYHHRGLPYGWDKAHPIRGIGFYDGPVFVTSTWFDNFASDQFRASGALGFLRKNSFGISPLNSVRNIKFGFSDMGGGNRVYDNDAAGDGEHFGDHDGDLVATFHDHDGSVTGIPNSQVVRNRPFLVTPQCLTRSNWNTAVCPGPMAALWIYMKNKKDGTQLTRDYTRVGLSRDDVPNVTEWMDGENMNEWILHKDHSYIVHWKTQAPPYIWMSFNALNKGDSIRIGVCMPRNAVFTVTVGHYSKSMTLTPAKTLRDLSRSTYFYDKTANLLLIKPESTLDRNPADNCPMGYNCLWVEVIITSGNFKAASCSPYPKYQVAPKAGSVKGMNQNMETTTPKPPAGWGAGPTKPFDSRLTIDGGWSTWSDWSPCSATCGPGTVSRSRGCNNPLPQNNGKDCPGSAIETKACSLKSCPINGGWSSWKTSACRIPSNNGCQGVKVKQRSCTNPGPKFGGNMCVGSAVELEACTCCDCAKIAKAFRVNSIIFPAK